MFGLFLAILAKIWLLICDIENLTNTWIVVEYLDLFWIFGHFWIHWGTVGTRGPIWDTWTHAVGTWIQFWDNWVLGDRVALVYSF